MKYSMFQLSQIARDVLSTLYALKFMFNKLFEVGIVVKFREEETET